MIPGAFLAEKFGGKWILSVVVFGGAICTLLSPVIANQYGFMGLVILRIIQGILQVNIKAKYSLLCTNYTLIRDQIILPHLQ